MLTVHTTLCSTKLTQNLGLLSLLKWRSEPDNLKHNLSVFTREVKAADVVKFLPDVLDALFSILMENSDSELYDNLVFEALVAVIEMVTEDKFKQFIPVLEVYINENYSATLASTSCWWCSRTMWSSSKRVLKKYFFLDPFPKYVKLATVIVCVIWLLLSFA